MYDIITSVGVYKVIVTLFISMPTNTLLEKFCLFWQWTCRKTLNAWIEVWATQGKVLQIYEIDGCMKKYVRIELSVCKGYTPL